jgi:hypothetical protein
MRRPYLLSILVLLTLAVLLLTAFDRDGAFWSQWGRNAQHTGMVNIDGQPLNRKLADVVYDPFVKQEAREIFGALAVHYQAALLDGNSFYMVLKSGQYKSCHPAGNWFDGAHCGPNTWNTLAWNVVRYDWKHGQPETVWTFPTDWKPEPNATNLLKGYSGLSGEEPVFHPVLSHGHLYVPGAAGTIWKVDRQSGEAEAHINPFAGAHIRPADTFVAGPLTADDDGNIYYHAIELNTQGNPWNQNDVSNAWLVKVSRDDTAATVTFAALVPNAPPANSQCPGTFFLLNDNGASLPWPPSPTAVPPTTLCGSQRPGLNVAPAVAPDGTVYTVSRSHLAIQVGYLVAVNPDLTTKWVTSLQTLLNDGCGVLLPIAPQGVTNEPNSCRFGTTVGVDPTTNAPGSGPINDAASSSPGVLPDGSIIYGIVDNYNYDKGHLLHFDSQGNYINSYTFGWDSTPGIYAHDGTYSIVIKDNNYGVPAYCFFQNPVCAFAPIPGPYYISQLDANLKVEWSFQSTTIDKNHPNGYEWCINAPVIDRQGIVYAISEDGHLYSLPQGHRGVFKKPKQKIALREPLPAAYTPLSISEDGKVYGQNAGHLLIVGR